MDTPPPASPPLTPTAAAAVAASTVSAAAASAAPVAPAKTTTFLQHFGLDRLNDTLTPLLNEQRREQDRFGHKWKAHEWEVPNPSAIAGIAATSPIISARAASPTSPIPSVQLSTAQESKFHFRTHALSPTAAKRKRERRDRLLAQQRQQEKMDDSAAAQTIDAQPVQPASKPGGGDGSSTLLRSMSAGARRQIELARTTSRSRSSSRPTSPLALSARATDAVPRALSSEDRVAWSNYSEFLARERAQIDSELHGVASVEELQEKLRVEQRAQAEAEQQIREREEAGSDSEDERASRSSSPRDSGREHGPASFGLLSSRRRRLPGATPQQFFLSHGHDRLYDGTGTDMTRVAREVKPPHKDLAEKMQSRASKSMVGGRFDTLYWIERESERKWLQAHLRQQQIQQAILTIQSMGSSQHATAALSTLLEATKRAVEPRDDEPMRPQSAAALRRAALPTPTPPVTAPSRTRSPSPAPSPPPLPPSSPQSTHGPQRSDSAPNFYPPSASAQLGMSAKGSQILSEQLPHLAGLVVAAEERSDPYGDMWQASAVEMSMAAAAAAKAGLAIPPPPPRRIQGAPTLTPRPPTRPSLIGPDSTENAVDPEPHLSAFRVSKRGVAHSAKAIAAYPGREVQTPRGVSEFGPRPATAEISMPLTDAAASRPDTAPSAPNPESSRTAKLVPFADTLHFPPQRYPPSAPTFTAICALTPLSAIEQAQPFQPHTPVSFKHRVKVTQHVAQRASLSMWPDATMVNQPLPFNIRAAKPSALSSDGPAAHADQGEPELVHIRPWAPRQDLHSSQLAHCVPRPPSSLLGASRSAQFTPPIPPVRSGSATARARGESPTARRRKSAASSGASTARPSRASSASMMQPKAPFLSSEVPLHTTGEFPVHVADASLSGTIASGVPDSVSSIDAPTHPKMSSAPHSPAAGRSPGRLVSPARSPARSPRNTMLEAPVDTLALTPAASASVQTGLHSNSVLLSSDSAKEFAALPESSLLEEGVSAWSSLPTPPSSRPASGIKREKRRRSSKRRKSKLAAGAASSAESVSPRRASGDKPHSPGRRSQNKLNAARAAGKAPSAPVVSEIPEFIPQAYTDASVSVRIPSHASTVSFSFDPAAADMLAAMKADAVFDPTRLAHQVASSPTTQAPRSPRLDNPSPSRQHLPRPMPARRPSTRYYGHDENGFPRSGDVSPAPGWNSDDGRSASLSPRSTLRASTELPDTDLFKPSVNFKTRVSWRNREVGDEVARPAPAARSSSWSKGQTTKLGAYEEAALRRHEPSTRWQLIDQEFEDQRVDVHAVERIQLARVTSHLGLVDHLGHPLADQKLSHYERSEGSGQKTAHGADSASEDSETDAELALLSKEEKEARWASRVAKQERRLQAHQAEIDRRIRDALDEEELQDELDDNVVAAAERTRRRRDRIARTGSLSLEEKVVADGLDLDAESRELQDRMAEFVAAETSQPTGLIHQANKIMRKEEREAMVRDQEWESGEPTAQQRRATAFQALDGRAEHEAESTGNDSNSDRESVSHGRKRSQGHGRQVSVSTFVFDHAQPAAKDASSSVPDVHPITAGSAPSVQDSQIFRRKTGDRAKAVSAKHAHALLATVSEGRGSRAVRNKKLAPAMRTQSTFVHARNQLATSEQLHRLLSPEDHLATPQSGGAEEIKVNDAAAPVPSLNFAGLTPRSATPSGTARRADSTLLNATGFATWHASSPLGLSRPATALATATPWQLARFERHARRDAQLSARQRENAARVNSAEQDRLQHIDLALSARAAALASERHFSLDLVPRVSNLHASALGGSIARPAVYVSHPHVPSSVVAPSQLLDKSVTHPLQRVKLLSHSSQRWSERQQHVIDMAAKLAQQEMRDGMRAAKAESVYFRS